MNLALLLDLARAHRGPLAVAAALAFAESLVLLALPSLGGALADRLFAPAGVGSGRVLAWMALVLAAGAALRICSALVAATTSAGILAALRRRMHDHLLALPLADHQRHVHGDLLALGTWEVSRLGDLLSVTLVALPAQVLTAATSLWLMARLDARLAVAAVLALPPFLLALRLIGRRLRARAAVTQEADAALVAAASEDLQMAPAIKAFGREERASARYADRARAARDADLGLLRLSSAIAPLTNLAAGLGAVGLLWLAAPAVASGRLSGADLLSLLLYAAVLTRPAGAMAEVYGRIQAARGTLGRLTRILALAPEPGTDAPVRLGRARGELVFEGVRLAYDGRAPALDGLDLHVRAGQTVALTGANGAGKTTLAHLVPRLMDPDAGVVRLDGHDLRDIRLGDLRAQVALVPQRPLLFDGTVGENIGWGREGATAGEIETAARLAQAHGFVADLPDGYATRIGENGVRLSGGQQQRVALARALLRDPPILILDEATSMWDLDGEGAFVAAARGALRDRTVLVITHRPATLALADRVVTLAGGRVVGDVAGG